MVRPLLAILVAVLIWTSWLVGNSYGYRLGFNTAMAEAVLDPEYAESWIKMLMEKP